MSKLCERPGCSEPGAAVYGMVAEDLLFWIVATDAETPGDAKLLCRRHADAMVVPRGWTLDDRRQPTPSLFQTRRYDTKATARATVPSTVPSTVPAAGVAANPPSVRRQLRRVGGQAVEQLQIDGTGPTPRPSLEQLAALDEAPANVGHLTDVVDVVDVGDASGASTDETTAGSVVTDRGHETVEDGTDFGAWRPEFDIDDDLDGLLETKSPLLARAFRGTARQR